MNSKGMAWGTILALIMAVAVVALLFFGPLKEIIVDKIFPIAENLPKPGNISKEPIIYGNIRYDIQSDRIQIYNGEKWNNFGKDVEFDGLGTVSESGLKSAFNSYYFDISKRSDTNIYSNGEFKITTVGLTKSDSSDPNLIFPGNTEIYKRGAVKANLQSSGNNILGTYYISSSRVFVYLPKNTVSPLASQEGELITKALAWRNSILKKPLILLGKEFCATLSDDKYLNIDLTKVGKCNE